MAAERRPIPLRPDPDLLRADTLTSLARATIARTMACLGHQRERDESTILRSRFPDDHSAAIMLRAVSSPLNTGAASAVLRLHGDVLVRAPAARHGPREAYLAARDTNDTKRLPGDTRVKQQRDKLAGARSRCGK
jgi:hypothetical protein